MIGEEKDRDVQRGLISLIANRVIPIESPLLKEKEKEDIKKDTQVIEYAYKGEPIEGGLACADFFDTIAISFLSDDEWDSPSIELTKQAYSEAINDIEEKMVQIKHMAKIEHLAEHKDFLEALAKADK